MAKHIVEVCIQISERVSAPQNSELMAATALLMLLSLIFLCVSIACTTSSKNKNENKEKLVFKVTLDKNAKLPAKIHGTDAGFDLFAPERFFLRSGSSTEINTGVHIEIPAGYAGFLKSRNDLNIKNSITGEGILNAGDTNPIVVKLYNKGESKVFEAGERIIQIIFLPIPQVELELADSLEKANHEDTGIDTTGVL